MNQVIGDIFKYLVIDILQGALPATPFECRLWLFLGTRVLQRRLHLAANAGLVHVTLRLGPKAALLHAAATQPGVIQRLTRQARPCVD